MTQPSSITVIRLSGELELSRRDEIRAALQVGGAGPTILIDFSEVTYADSTTLAELLRFSADAERENVVIAVLIASKQFARIIEYAGLAQVFKIFSDRGAALTYLGTFR